MHEILIKNRVLCERSEGSPYTHTLLSGKQEIKYKLLRDKYGPLSTPSDDHPEFAEERRDIMIEEVTALSFNKEYYRGWGHKCGQFPPL